MPYIIFAVVHGSYNSDAVLRAMILKGQFILKAFKVGALLRTYSNSPTSDLIK